MVSSLFYVTIDMGRKPDVGVEISESIVFVASKRVSLFVVGVIGSVQLPAKT
jgi:hypothetical protein